MQSKDKTIDRIAFVMWSGFSYLFFGFGILLFLNILLRGEYYPSPEFSRGSGPKIWEALWDLRGLIIAPAPVLLLGVLFRRFAASSKFNRNEKENTHVVVSK